MTQNIVALVDLDDEGSAQITLANAIDHARHTGARLHILNVVPDGMLKMTIVAQLIPDDYEQKLADHARQQLTALIGQQETEGVAVEPAVRLGSVYKEVLRYARDVEADLIVMGAHRPEVKDYLLGSNAAQVVRHAPCSVWVVRA
ncbi:MAG: universal stress protein [Methyloligellaceae bacterium]